jgi:hypothetical protein
LSLISGRISLNLFLKHRMSSISYSKDWGHDPFNTMIFLCLSIGIKYGLLSHQTACWFSKAMYSCIPMVHGNYKYKRLPMGIKIGWSVIYFKISCLSLSKIWNMLRLSCYLDDLLIITNIRFKDYLLKLKMILERLLTNALLVWD